MSRLSVAFEADEIARYLPHRYPFLLLDRVVDVEPGERAVAIKNISGSDPVFAGHFPDRKIYPGVLLVECVAQAAAIVYGTEAERQATSNGGSGDPATRVGYLAEIRQAKFLRPVTPGDQLVIEVLSGQRLGPMISVTGSITVGAERVLTVRLAVTTRTPEQDVKE